MNLLEKEKLKFEHEGVRFFTNAFTETYASNRQVKDSEIYLLEFSTGERTYGLFIEGAPVYTSDSIEAVFVHADMINLVEEFEKR